jgi:hypothetical protein
MGLLDEFDRHLSAYCNLRTVPFLEASRARQALETALTEVCKERDELRALNVQLEEAVLSKAVVELRSMEFRCVMCGAVLNWVSNKREIIHFPDCIVLSIESRRKA